MLTYRNTAKIVRKKKLPKLDIYDDKVIDLMDDLASRWAMRMDALARQQKRKITT